MRIEASSASAPILILPLVVERSGLPVKAANTAKIGNDDRSRPSAAP